MARAFKIEVKQSLCRNKTFTLLADYTLALHAVFQGKNTNENKSEPQQKDKEESIK